MGRTTPPVGACSMFPRRSTRSPPATPPVFLQPSSCTNGIDYIALPFNSTLDIGGDPAALGLTCDTDDIWDWVGYVRVPDGSAGDLKVTVALERPAGAAPEPGAGKRSSTTPLLVYDLDVVVTQVSGKGSSELIGPSHYSWWLDPTCPYRPAAQVAVPTWDPETYSDHRNTVEQVVVPDAAAGWWRIIVRADTLTGTQPFGITISLPE